MDDTVTLRVRLHGDAIRASTLPWSELRRFVDVFVEALVAMPGGPRAQDIVLRAVEEGSAIPVVHVPRANLPATWVLAAGPNRRWTTDQRRAVEPLYDFVRDRKASVEVGQRALRKVVIPDQASKWSVRERAEVRGTVVMVGGRDPKVRVDIDGEGLVICDARPSVVKELGAHLLDSVFIEGVFVRDAFNGTILRGIIERWRVAPVRSQGSQALRDLHEYLSGCTDGFDVQAYVKEQRS